MNGHARIVLIRGALFQVALVAMAAGVYFLVRGLTQGDADTAVRNAETILRWERTLRLDFEQGLQDLVLRNHAAVTVANWVYMWGHWPVIGPVLLMLYIRDRRHYVVLRNAMFASGAVGLVIFALWPAAPPRLMPQSAGFVDTVTLWSDSYRVLQPPALVNKYAAMPSFHFGWNLLVGIIVWTTFRNRVARVFAVVGPVLMAVAVVATANHFVLDFVVGGAISLVALACSYRVYDYTYRHGLDLAHVRLLGADDAEGAATPERGSFDPVRRRHRVP
jgi:hypothetical protein